MDRQIREQIYATCENAYNFLDRHTSDAEEVKSKFRDHLLKVLESLKQRNSLLTGTMLLNTTPPVQHTPTVKSPTSQSAE